MFHHREWLIKVMEQGAPLFVAVRTPEAHGMGLNAAPAHQQEVASLGFDAGPDFEVDEARSGGDQRQSLVHSRLEGSPLLRLYAENGVFEDHKVGLPDILYQTQ